MIPGVRRITDFLFKVEVAPEVVRSNLLNQLSQLHLHQLHLHQLHLHQLLL